ncbi:hypothetical protein [Anatilimnocola floriformis]|uniref:hypothetical protein n=1 Tax=Anatilimnocola floriformis TaxID=2948575 RepID=UPI0020C2D1A3|nr:hypothetical protein [Anatilimnocola floriformis]
MDFGKHLFIGIVLSCGLALCTGCAPANQPVAKQSKKLVAKSTKQTTQPKPVAPTKKAALPPKVVPQQPTEEQPTNEFAQRKNALTPQELAVPAPAVPEITDRGVPREYPLPQLDDGKIAAAGIRKLTGKHLILYTDVPEKVEDIKNLPTIFDAAVVEWGKYFSIDQAKLANWKMVGCVMVSKERFQGAGLYGSDVPDFPNGYQTGAQFWLFDQPSDYYRRHLLLHEGTHAFMSHHLGGAGPPWYSEGMAELLGTHLWDGQRLVLGYNPPDKTQVPYWGRVKIVRDEFAANRGMTLSGILTYDAQAHLKNEAYGWCWAATTFLNAHPQTTAPFQDLRKKTADSTYNFTRMFFKELHANWPQIVEDWQLYVINLEYGYDVARAATVRKPAQPLTEPTTVTVVADRAWQSTGILVEAGQTYELTATGRYTLAREPKPWVCEPNGITLEYHQHQPLGILLAAVSDPKHNDTMVTPLSQPDVIGSAGRIKPLKSGTLYLCLNDSPAKLADNEGSATVVVRSAPDR